MQELQKLQEDLKQERIYLASSQWNDLNGPKTSSFKRVPVSFYTPQKPKAKANYIRPYFSTEGYDKVRVSNIIESHKKKSERDEEEQELQRIRVGAELKLQAINGEDFPEDEEQLGEQTFRVSYQQPWTQKKHGTTKIGEVSKHSTFASSNSYGSGRSKHLVN